MGCPLLAFLLCGKNVYFFRFSAKKKSRGSGENDLSPDNKKNPSAIRGEKNLHSETTPGRHDWLEIGSSVSFWKPSNCTVIITTASLETCTTSEIRLDSWIRILYYSARGSCYGTWKTKAWTPLKSFLLVRRRTWRKTHQPRFSPRFFLPTNTGSRAAPRRSNREEFEKRDFLLVGWPCLGLREEAATSGP